MALHRVLPVSHGEVVLARIDLRRNTEALPPGVRHGEEGVAEIKARVVQRGRQVGPVDEIHQVALRPRPDPAGDIVDHGT